MGMRIYLDDAERLADEVWRASLSPSDVSRIGSPHLSRGRQSVIGVFGGIDALADHQITFDPGAAEVLNAGRDPVVLIIKLDDPDGRKLVRHGDQAFLASCEEHLTPDLTQIAADLLASIRDQYPGQLKEGKARKWVNDPDNFVALTIQNRDKSFAVYVKGRVQDHQEPDLDLKPDRPGYSRFKLRERHQIPAALHIIMASAER